jgi:hypothetical protein
MLDCMGVHHHTENEMKYKKEKIDRKRDRMLTAGSWCGVFCKVKGGFPSNIKSMACSACIAWRS